MSNVTQHINLYHAEFHPARHPLPAAWLFGGILLMLGLTLLLYAFDAWRLASMRNDLAGLEQRAGQLETQLQTLSGQFAGRQADPALAAELAGQEARLRSLTQAEQAIRAGALGGSQGYSGHLTALGRVQAKDVWIVGLALRGAPTRMSLTGRALDSAGPARYVAALRREPFFGGLAFAGLEIREMTGPAPGGVLEFSLAGQPDPVVVAATTKPDSAPEPPSP